MKSRTPFERFALTGLALGLVLHAVAPRGAEAQGVWPDRAENLQVLPADLPPERLRAVMQGFTNALGVRCSHCHEGVEGAPLSSFDFVSDAVPAKATTRRMLEMLGDINDHLSEIEPSGPERVNMWCHTCHTGKPRPMTLAETLAEARLEGRTSEVLARFSALREEFYGGNQYDFRAPNVASTAVSLVAAGDTASGLALLERNVEHYPTWWQSHERLGDIHRARGEEELAVRWYERALELAPEQPRLLQKLGR